MKDDKNTAAQPELYKCDCCENHSTTHYDLDIQVEFEDEAAGDDTGWREWHTGCAATVIIIGMRAGCQPAH